MQRGVLLFQQQRWELAAEQFRAALAEDSENALAHAFLALCLSERGDHDSARRASEAALGLEPEVAFVHYARSRCQAECGELGPALESIDEAIRLDPDDADYAARRASLLLRLERPREALEEAERALASDATHVNALNMRSIALVALGRQKDAGLGLRAALESDPDNAVTHANLGWTHLHSNRPREARAAFREALRLDPEQEWAREGLLEALRAKNVLYRVVLAYFLALQRLAPKLRWVVVVGILVIGRVLRVVAKEVPAAEAFILPLSLALSFFVWMTWLAAPLSDALLLFSRDGRMVLSRPQKLRSLLLVGVIGLALVLAACAVQWSVDGLLFTAAGVFLLSLPLVATFGRRPGWPLVSFLVVTLMAALGVLTFGLLALLSEDPQQAQGLGILAMGCGLLAAAATSIGSWFVPSRES